MYPKPQLLRTCPQPDSSVSVTVQLSTGEAWATQSAPNPSHGRCHLPMILKPTHFKVLLGHHNGPGTSVLV